MSASIKIRTGTNHTSAYSSHMLDLGTGFRTSLSPKELSTWEKEYDTRQHLEPSGRLRAAQAKVVRTAFLVSAASHLHDDASSEWKELSTRELSCQGMHMTWLQANLPMMDSSSLTIGTGLISAGQPSSSRVLEYIILKGVGQ